MSAVVKILFVTAEFSVFVKNDDSKSFRVIVQTNFVRFKYSVVSPGV